MKAAWLATASFFICIFLSSQIQGDVQASAEPFQDDPLFQMLGSAKEVLGDMVYLKADSYFHGGLRADMLESFDESHGLSEEDHEETERHLEKNFKPADWVDNVYRQVYVSEHRHMEKENSQEMLPILGLSVKLNPHNISAVLSSAYWLQNRSGDDNQALAVLTQGYKDNPDSWEIVLELGKIYFELKKDPKTAIDYYLSAIRNMEKAEHEWFDPILARYHLAEAYLQAGDKENASKFYKEALVLYPDQQESALKEILKKKILEMEAPA